MKVGRDPDGGRGAGVALARELAGEDALIGADANGGWPLPGRARDGSAACRVGIAFIEQPVRADDLEGLREVRALGVPLVADESVYSPADVLRIGRLGAADIVSVYVGKSSALERAVESARLARRARDGRRHRRQRRDGHRRRGAAPRRVRLRAPQPIPHGIIGHHFYEDDDSLAAPLEIDGLVARLPDGPGLGVEPSDEVRRSFSA